MMIMFMEFAHLLKWEWEKERGMNTQLKKQYHTVFVTLGAKPCHNALYYFNVEMFCFILEVFTKHTKTCIIYKINTLKICLAYFCINLKDESTYLNMIWMYLLKFSKIQIFYIYSLLTFLDSNYYDQKYS